jgi:DNA modification methylase
MRTTHRVHVGDARRMAAVADGTVALVVTSPPYPMIAMWDDVFAALDPATGRLLARDPAAAFEAQHACLDAVWRECWRVLVPGGLLCVNIGDATRSADGEFRLWPNHARIVTACARIGFSSLPDILWRKPTNAPNKFMGSGMLPTGAYVTYEHEYVLIFRRGPPRPFVTPEARASRRESAYFWEERNVWFSDLWTDLVGVGQGLGAPRRATQRGAAPRPSGAAAAGGALFAGLSAGMDPPSRGASQAASRTSASTPSPRVAPAPTDRPDAPLRDRSAAFPLELPARLIHMYSLHGDTVLDPFVGTGTTLLAAACAGRDSVGIELSPGLAAAATDAVERVVDVGTARVQARLDAHAAFVARRLAEDKPPKHHNFRHDVAVVTRQEVDLALRTPVAVTRGTDGVTVDYTAPAPVPSGGDEGDDEAGE